MSAPSSCAQNKNAKSVVAKSPAAPFWGAGCVTIVGGAAGLVFYERSQNKKGGGANGKSTSAVDYTKLDETTLKSKLANRKGVPNSY